MAAETIVDRMSSLLPRVLHSSAEKNENISLMKITLQLN